MSEQAVKLQRVVADFDLADGEQAVANVAFVDEDGVPVGLDGGAVASVNGKTGAVVLAAADFPEIEAAATAASDAQDDIDTHAGNAGIHVPAAPAEGTFVLTATDGVIAWVASA